MHLQSENWGCLQQQKQKQQGCELLSVCSHLIMDGQHSELMMQILSEMSSQMITCMLLVLCKVNKNLYVEILSCV